MSAKVTMQVTGVKETLREIGKIDKSLRRQITKDFKAIGMPVVTEAKNNVPKEPPITGWGRKWQTASGFQMLPWQSYNAAKLVDTQVSSKRPREYRGVVRDLAVVAIRWRGTVNTLFDTARDWETPQGENMIKGLNDKHGKASRIMWPAYEKNADKVENEIQQKVREVMAIVNRQVQ